MPPLPPCTTTGIINLCNPAPYLSIPLQSPQTWVLTIPNLIWFLLVLLLLVLGIFLPFKQKDFDTEGYEIPGEEEA
jgi:hypothetical protein